jgi:hypothetical protein
VTVRVGRSTGPSVRPCAYHVITLLVAFALAFGATGRTAHANVVEIGGGTGEATPFCSQEPCLAVTGVTAFESSIDGRDNQMVVPFAGQLASFSVALAKPAPLQITDFDQAFGSPAVALAVLEPVGRLGRYRIAAESQLFQVASQLGTTDQFPISPIDVAPGDVVALAIPSWLPALSPAGNDDTWFAARADCTHIPLKPARQPVGMELTPNCEYEARILYTATLVSGDALPTIPRFSLEWRIGRTYSQAPVLLSLTVRGLPSGATGRLVCRTLCSRLALGRPRTEDRAGTVEFSALNLLVAHGISLELRVSQGSALGRFERIRVGPGGVGFASSGCLLPDAPKYEPRGYVEC